MLIERKICDLGPRRLPYTKKFNMRLKMRINRGLALGALRRNGEGPGVMPNLGKYYKEDSNSIANHGG